MSNEPRTIRTRAAKEAGEFIPLVGANRRNMYRFIPHRDDSRLGMRSALDSSQSAVLISFGNGVISESIA